MENDLQSVGAGQGRDSFPLPFLLFSFFTSPHILPHSDINPLSLARLFTCFLSTHSIFPTVSFSTKKQLFPLPATSRLLVSASYASPPIFFGAGSAISIFPAPLHKMFHMEQSGIPFPRSAPILPRTVRVSAIYPLPIPSSAKSFLATPRLFCI